MIKGMLAKLDGIKVIVSPFLSDNQWIPFRNGKVNLDLPDTVVVSPKLYEDLQQLPSTEAPNE